MPTKLTFAVFVAMGVAFWCVPVHAVYIRHDRPVADYNAIAARNSFASSGFLADSLDGFQLGSATLVSPTKVLTAAHVVDGDGDLLVDRPLAFKRWTFGVQSNIPALLTGNVKSVKINPNYKGGRAAYDLAVITLKAPVNFLPPGALSTANPVGKRGAMVGYGFQGNGLSRSVDGATNKLGAFNEISVLQDGTYRTDFDSPKLDKSTFGSAVPLTYEGTTASGDSGSALWAEFGANTWKIVGVLNGGFNEKGFDSEYGDISIYASLANSRNITFLRNQGLAIDGVGGVAVSGRSSVVAGSAPTELRAVPEPSGAALLLVVSASALFSRRLREKRVPSRDEPVLPRLPRLVA